MDLEIYGDKIFCELDFHNEIARQLNVDKCYGKNIDTLWNLLSTGVERPINLVWIDTNISKNRISSFEKIISILEKVKEQDEKFEWEDKFTFSLIS